MEVIKKMYMKLRRWQINAPSSGFLYPSFAERSEDRNEVVFKTKTPNLEDFLNSLFKAEEVSSGMEEQKAVFSAFLSEIGVSLEEASGITETLLEHSADEEENYVKKDVLKRIVEDAGANVEKFDDAYDSILSETSLTYDALADTSLTIKTDVCSVKAPSDHAEIIRTQEIDGRMYILIPADGEVTVNGTLVSI